MKFYGWRIVLALGVTALVSYGTTQYLFGVLVTPVSAEFGWDRAAVNSGYAGMLLVAGFAAVGIGRALDRFGARVLMSLGSLVGGLSLLALAHVDHLWQFVALWTLGLGFAAAATWYPISFTVIANWFRRDRPRALALLTFMGAFASPIFYPLAGILTARLGWREAVTVLGGLQLGLALPLHATVVRRHPEDRGLAPDGAPAAAVGAPIEGVAYAAALRSREFWLLATSIALGMFASTIVLVEQIAYLIARGTPAAAAASLAGLLGLAYLPGRGLLTVVRGRLPLRLQFALALLAQAGGIAILLGARGVAMVVVYLLVFGGAYGAFAPLRGALTAAYFGRRDYGTIIAIQGLPVALLSAAGPVVAGTIIDHAGYTAAFGATLGASLLGASIVAFMPPPPRT